MICTKPCRPQAQLRQAEAGLLPGEGCACSSPSPALPLPALGTVLARIGPEAWFLLAETLQKCPQTPSGEPTRLWKHDDSPIPSYVPQPILASSDTKAGLVCVQVVHILQDTNQPSCEVLQKSLSSKVCFLTHWLSSDKRDPFYMISS